MENVKIIVNNGIIISIENSQDIILQIDNNIRIFKNAEIRPSYSDSHCHVWGLGMMNSGLDLSSAKSAEETAILAYKNNFSRGNFIVGRAWNNETWQDKSFPNKRVLDSFFPNIPVVLTRNDGHSVWCNSVALKIAEINNLTPNPDGGYIFKDENNEPTGILIDNAMDLVNSQIPDFTNEQIKEFILLGLNICEKNGITTLHDMDLSRQHIEVYKNLANNNLLKSKVFAYASAQNNQLLNGEIQPFSNNNFKIQGIKLYADGALGSYGAALLEDYSDKIGEKGLLLISPHQILENCLAADELGLDVAIHAIGDNAVRTVLDGYELFRNKKPESKINLRIEHSQIVNQKDLVRYKKLNVIASVQAIHFTSDVEMAFSRLGLERMINSAYPWKSFLDNDILIIAGSDFPIETYSVDEGINSFVNRENPFLIYPFIKNQKISFDEAINCYTNKPFMALGIKNRGKIELNYKTDFNIFSNNKLIETIIIN